ncbi:tRNA (adenosine(37)-N6)-threonylcarbamoyltransferase complex dimerization subunit type 1 TsaB [Dehalococcoides mccartyi]|nr:tRNA (adenosine(37)-N6)-threonylcarbamoyltransferase complex dimerization subunit type 1 TsaB [Dehalococcoides mccartyi]
MILITIDTSTRFASVGAVDENGKRATRSWHSAQNHGRELMPAIVESLAELSLAPNQISQVAVATGPGGFSAVRVGISAALGLVVPHKLPVVGILTHDLELEPFADSLGAETPIYTLIPAGRNEISWTKHDLAKSPETGVASPEELVSKLEPTALICGEACDLMAGLIDQDRFRGTASPTRDPNSLIDIAIRKFESGLSTPYEELRPVYARPPSITKPKPAK